MNKRKRFWVATAIIAVAVISGFLVSVPRISEEPQLTESAPPSVVPLVTLHDSYKKGTHTITGSIEAPTPCTLLSADAHLEGDASTTPERIVVSLSMPQDTGICLQVLTMLDFSTSIVAPADLPIVVMVNNTEATTTSS